MADLGDSPARTHFAALVARQAVPLAETALAIAEEEYPRLGAGEYLTRLDALAREVERHLPRSRGAAATIKALRTVLSVEHGFRGNSGAYYDPRNSFLNEVLERRLGIPITLAIVYLEVAARVGLALQGVGLPGHFLVKYAAGEREIFLDPFHGGEILSAEDCVERFRNLVPGHQVEPRHLHAVTTRQTLARLLHNLKKIYVETGDDVRALWVVDRLVLLSPSDAGERRDRGLIEARLGGVRAALRDLDAYLAAAPTADDAGSVRELTDRLRGQAPLVN